MTKTETPTISVLVSARKNSKYLAKFLFGYFNNTKDLTNTELLVIFNANDEWNLDLIQFYQNHYKPAQIKFLPENLKLGRGGLHEYFNKLYKYSKNQWIIYFCEDHYIFYDGWDDYVRQIITGGSRSMQHKTDGRQLNYQEPYCIIPKFDNVGAMNQILSRGYVEALGGVLGRHGWIDSYINDVNHEAFGVEADRPNNKAGDRVIKMDDETFHDFTHDAPDPLDPINNITELSADAKAMPKYYEHSVRTLVLEDAKKIRKALDELPK